MSKLKTEVAFVEKNGRTFSKRTAYYENGQIAEVGIYAIGQHGWGWNIPVGVVKSYFENGQLKSELAYNESGILDGECVYFDLTGALIKKLTYSQDKLIKEEILKVEEAVKDKY